MEKRVYTRGQTSEAVSTGIFLTLSGGFQGAYTYYCGGGIFANTRTSNVVLMGSHLAFRGQGMVFRYMAPVAAFACGVHMAEHIRRQHKHNRQFHWRQMVVAIEIILLSPVGFMPRSMSMAVNIAVSSVCAMQVNAFRRIKGDPRAATMCIGNLRSDTEHFYTYRHTKNPESRDRCTRYCEVIAIFLVSAVLGAMLATRLTEKTIWVSCGLLLVDFLIMFLQEDMGERERTQQGTGKTIRYMLKAHERVGDCPPDVLLSYYTCNSYSICDIHFWHVPSSPTIIKLQGECNHQQAKTEM